MSFSRALDIFKDLLIIGLVSCGITMGLIAIGAVASPVAVYMTLLAVYVGIGGFVKFCLDSHKNAMIRQFDEEVMYEIVQRQMGRAQPLQCQKALLDFALHEALEGDLTWASIFAPRPIQATNSPVEKQAKVKATPVEQSSAIPEIVSDGHVVGGHNLRKRN